MLNNFNPFLDDEPEVKPRQPWERDYSDDEKADMRRRKKAGELLPGHKAKKHPNERSISNLTAKDFRVMRHLGIHKGASSRIAGVLMGVNTRTVHNRLDSLRRLKLVNYHDVGGDTRYFWYLTPAGKKMLVSLGYALDYELATGRPKFKTEVDTHALAVSMTAAHLVAGTVSGKQGTPVDDRLLIGETAIKSKWQTVLGGFTRAEAFGKGGAGQELKIKVLNAVKAGQLQWDEVLDAEPALWTLTGPVTSPKIENFHLPDLVLSREEGRGEAPESIAYEIELTQKSPEAYERTLRLYKQDAFVFKKVVWVVNSRNTMKAIAKAAKNVGLTADRVGFEWLRGEDGRPFTDFTYKL